MMPVDDSALIAMGCDERYCFPLAVAMYSALKSAGKPLRVVVLSDGIQADSQARLKAVAARGGAKSVQIIEVNTQDFTRHDRGSAHLSVATFARLLIPKLLPTEKRCLWVDSDVLVRRDLNELWKLDLAGKPIAAVQCYYVPTVGLKHGIPYLPEANASPDTQFFNGGIFLLDLDYWRDNDLDEQVSGFLNQHGSKLNAADQDVLNAIFFDNWLPLPGMWNDQEAVNQKARGSPPAYIRHFSGPQKPWNSGLFDSDCREWLEGARDSRFYGPIAFAAWRLRRLEKVLRGTGNNWLKANGWMK